MLAEGRYLYIAQDIDKLKSFSKILPQLYAVARAVPEDRDRNNALLEVAQGYFNQGNIERSLEILEEMGTPGYATFYILLSKYVLYPNYWQRAMRIIRKIPATKQWECLVAAGDLLYERGDKKGANELYQDSWKVSSKLTRKEQLSNAVETFVSLMREKNISFASVDSVYVVNEAVNYAQEWLNAISREDSPSFPPVPDFIFSTIYHLAKEGQYPRAEELVRLIDQKYRIEHWGAQAAHYRCDERDRGYERIIRAAGERKDYAKIEESVKKMQDYMQEAMLDAAKILAGQGEYQNALVGSILSKAAIDWENSAFERGAISRRLIAISAGQPLYEVGHIMLEQGIDSEKVMKLYIKAAEIGVNEYALEDIIDDIRKHPELRPALLDVLKHAVQQNANIIAHHQLRVVLSTLREFYPELVGSQPLLISGDNQKVSGEESPTASPKQEIVDVVDDNNRVVGQIGKDDAHKTGAQHRGVTILLVASDGRVVFQRRAPNKKTFANRLDVSVAGHVKAGITYDETAQAEISEESPIPINFTRLQPVDIEGEYFKADVKDPAIGHNRELKKVYIVRLTQEEVEQIKRMDAEKRRFWQGYPVNAGGSFTEAQISMVNQKAHDLHPGFDQLPSSDRKKIIQEAEAYFEVAGFEL